jgi:hypothetical protein
MTILHFKKLISLPTVSVGNLFGVSFVEEMFVRYVERKKQIGVIAVPFEHWFLQ